MSIQPSHITLYARLDAHMQWKGPVSGAARLSSIPSTCTKVWISQKLYQRCAEAASCCPWKWDYRLTELSFQWSRYPGIHYIIVDISEYFKGSLPSGPLGQPWTFVCICSLRYPLVRRRRPFRFTGRNRLWAPLHNRLRRLYRRPSQEAFIRLFVLK